MQTGISRWIVRALGVICLALPLTLPTAAEAAKVKPQATAKGKHKVAAKKHKAMAQKAKAAKHAKKAGQRKIAKAHAPKKAKAHRTQPVASLGAGQAASSPAGDEMPRQAKTACASDGKIYLLADCQQLAAN